MSYPSDGTYVEDMKDPVEVQLPGRNRVLVIPRVENSGESIPSPFLGDLLSNLIHGSAIPSIISELSRPRI